MKYAIDLPPREFDAMIRDLQSQIASVARYKLALKATLGAAHPDVLNANTEIARMERAVTALHDAKYRAEYPQPVTPRRESVARNVGDELSFVAGRPRNDPRTPRKRLK